MNKIERFEDIIAWQKARKLVAAIYKLTCTEPFRHDFALRNQLRSSAISIPANIAEGAAKRGSAEFRRFLDVAVGSFSEVSYALLFAHEVGFLSTEEYRRLDTVRSRAGKVLWGLYASIARKARKMARETES